MKQAIAGVAPVGDNEVTSMTVWPGNTSVHTPPLGRLGCLLGRLYNIRFGLGSILTAWQPTGPGVDTDRNAIVCDQPSSGFRS